MINIKNRPVIIAELGINHNGSFDTLLRLTDAAFENGADYVKLQMRNPEICVPRDQWYKSREWFDGTDISYIEYKKRMEFSEQQLKMYSIYVKKHYGLDPDRRNRWSASVWDEDSALKLSGFHVPWVKIPSAMVTNKALLRVASNLYRKVILSTGMSTKAQVYNALSNLSGNELVLMACHSAYPTPPNEEDLNKIQTLENMIYDHVDLAREMSSIGYSSHAPNPFVPIYSIFAGAEYIEVHFTLDRTMQGTDHASSLEPNGLRLLAREAKRIPILFGNGELYIRDSELSSLKKLRGNQ